MWVAGKCHGLFFLSVYIYIHFTFFFYCTLARKIKLPFSGLSIIHQYPLMRCWILRTQGFPYWSDSLNLVKELSPCYVKHHSWPGTAYLSFSLGKLLFATLHFFWLKKKKKSGRVEKEKSKCRESKRTKFVKTKEQWEKVKEENT